MRLIALTISFVAFSVLVAYSQTIRRSGFVGVRAASVTDSLRISSNCKNGNGATVQEVLKGGTAEGLGVKPGDVIIAVNGKPIIKVQDLQSASAGTHEGDEVEYKVRRKNKALTLKGKVKGYPLEQDSDFITEYGQFAFKDGFVRSIITRPKTDRKLPAILILTGLSCHTIDGGIRPNMYRELAKEFTRRGFIVMRAEKPGIGDNTNTPECETIDFPTEVASFTEAYKSLESKPYVDTANIFVFGHSIGGMEAPLVASKMQPRGVIAYGITTKNWFEYILEITRYQNPRFGEGYPEVERDLQLYYTMLYELLIRDRGVKEVLALNPAYEGLLKRDFNYRGGNDFAMRDVSFTQTLQKVNILSEWLGYKGNVLAAHGEADIQTGGDQSTKELVRCLNKARPGSATFFSLPATDHLLLPVRDEEEAFRLYLNPPDYFNVMAGGFNTNAIDSLTSWINQTINK